MEGDTAWTGDWGTLVTGMVVNLGMGLGFPFANEGLVLLVGGLVFVEP